MRPEMYKQFNFGASLDDENDYDDPTLTLGWTIESAWMADGTFAG